MSRIGKKPILIPNGVNVTTAAGLIRVSGPKGEVSRLMDDALISVEIADNQILLKTVGSNPRALKLWGTYGSHIKNMIHGVTEGYEKSLEIEGIGFRAELSGTKLILNLGFSHPVEVEPLEGIVFRVAKNVITISGVDKEKVGEMASRIRSLKKPEPYKGKGIKYRGEIILRKAGKKAAATGS